MGRTKNEIKKIESFAILLRIYTFATTVTVTVVTITNTLIMKFYITTDYLT